MRFILFTEGQTERNSLPHFLKRWLDPRLPQPVGVKSVNFHGWRGFVKDIPTKAHLHLKDANTIAVIGLIDLHGPTFYPAGCAGPQDRCAWARKYLEDLVGSARYHQFLAVHEVEAWLLSEPSIFPSNVAARLKSIGKQPEEVNSARPPAKLLDECYQSASRRSYRKVVDGNSLFQKLDPNIAYESCPNLRAMLDCMLLLAQNT